MNPVILAGIIRTALAAGSGALVAVGVIDQGTAADASTNLEAIIGGIGGLLTLGWSIYSKLDKG
jgi:hypothetical protein